MAGNRSRILSSSRPTRRIPDPLLGPASPPRQVAGIVPNVPARLSVGSLPLSGSREHDPEGSPGDRTRSAPRLLQPPLSSRKGIWSLETGGQPLPPQIRTTNPVQDGDHRLSAPLGQKGRLPGLCGPERRVLPDPHPPLVQKVAPFCHKRDGSSVQGALLRTVNRPAGFHESFHDSIGLGLLPWCSTSPIFGRLVGPGLLGDQSQAARLRSTLALSLPRHSDKRREVRPQPVPVCGVPRHVHRHSGCPSLPHSSTRGEIPLNSEMVPVPPEPPRPALAGVVGTRVIAGEAGSPWETQDAIDTVASEVPLVPRERPSPPPGTPVPAGQGGPLLVDGEGPPPQGDELRNADSGSPPLLRRVTVGVGSSPPRSISVGNMVGTGKLATHQSARDESSVPSHEIVRRRCHQPSSDSNVQQFDGRSLCQQAGGHSLRLPLLVDRATSPMDRVPQCPSGSEVPARAVQCPGRSPQPSELGTGCRMVPPSAGGEETDSNLGVPVAGLVRDTSQREAAPVLLPNPGLPGRLRGCLPSPLERPRHVSVSSFPPGRESRGPSQRDPKSLDDLGRPSLVGESVVR